MTTVFTEHPLVIYERSETDSQYVFPFRYYSTRDIRVWTALREDRILERTLLIEGIDYTIEPASGPTGTVTLLSPTEAYNYLIIGREYGYGQEFVMPGAYSAPIIQTTADALGMQTQQLAARVEYLEIYGGGPAMIDGDPYYIARFNEDSTKVVNSSIINRPGLIDFLVPLRGVSAKFANVLEVKGTTTLNSLIVSSIDLQNYILLSGYKFYYKLTQPKESQVFQLRKGAHSDAESWDIVNVDASLLQDGIPGQYARYIGEHLVGGEWGILPPIPLAAQVDCVLTARGANDVEWLPPASPPPGNLHDTIETTEEAGGVLRWSAVGNRVTPSTPNQMARYISERTLAGVDGQPVPLAGPADANRFLSTDGQGPIWTDLPGSTIPPVTNMYDTVEVVNDGGTLKWAAVPNRVTPSIPGQMASYNDDRTIIGVDGQVVPLSTAGDADKYLTTDGVTTSWVDLPAPAEIPAPGNVNDAMETVNDGGTLKWAAVPNRVTPGAFGQLAQYSDARTLSGVAGELVPGAVPGDAGKFLTTDGSAASWAFLPPDAMPPAVNINDTMEVVDQAGVPAWSAVPSRVATGTAGQLAKYTDTRTIGGTDGELVPESVAGDAGKYLTTDGTTASWVDLPVVTFPVTNLHDTVEVIDNAGTLEWGPTSNRVNIGTAGNIAKYSDERTITGVAGELVPTSTAGDAGKVLTSDGTTGLWQALPPPVSSVKPSTVGYVAQYDTPTTVSGVPGIFVPPVDATTAGMILMNDGTNVFWGLPTPPPPPGEWSEITFPESHGGYIVGVETIGYYTPDHFYLISYTSGGGKVFKVNSTGPIAPVKAFDFSAQGSNGGLYVVAQYFVNKYIAIISSRSTQATRGDLALEIYDPVSHTKKNTYSITSSRIFTIHPAIEILENGDIAVAYHTYDSSTATTHAALMFVIYVYDGAWGFTPSTTHTLASYSHPAPDFVSPQLYKENGSNILRIFVTEMPTSGQGRLRAYTMDVTTPTVAPVVTASGTVVGNASLQYRAPRFATYIDFATNTAHIPDGIWGGATAQKAGMAIDPVTGATQTVNWTGGDLDSYPPVLASGCCGFSRGDPAKAIMCWSAGTDAAATVSVFYSDTGGAATGGNWRLAAERTNLAITRYSPVSRPFLTDNVICIPGSGGTDGVAACLLFRGGLPDIPAPPPPPYTWQRVDLSSPVPYNGGHTNGVTTRGAGAQDHFYVTEYYVHSDGIKRLKFWKFNIAGDPFVATFAFEITGNATVETYSAQYCLNRFFVVGVTTNNSCRVEVYDAVNYVLLYTVPKPAEIIDNARIVVEALENGSFVITYLISPSPSPGGFRVAVQHVAFDGTATFTPGPLIVYLTTPSYTTTMDDSGFIEIIPQEGTGLLYLFLRFTAIDPANSLPVLTTALHTFDPATPTVAPVVVHNMASTTTDIFVTGGTRPQTLVGQSIYFDQATGTGYVPNSSLTTPLLAMGVDGSTGLPGFVPYNDLPAGQNLWIGGYNPSDPNEALLLCGSASDATKMGIYYSTTGGGANAAWELLLDNAGGLANHYVAELVSCGCVWVTNDIVILGGAFGSSIPSPPTYCQIGKRNNAMAKSLRTNGGKK